MSHVPIQTPNAVKMSFFTRNIYIYIYIYMFTSLAVVFVIRSRPISAYIIYIHIYIYIYVLVFGEEYNKGDVPNNQNCEAIP